MFSRQQPDFIGLRCGIFNFFSFTFCEPGTSPVFCSCSVKLRLHNPGEEIDWAGCNQEISIASLYWDYHELSE